jgi:hypothetical protein
MADAIDRKQHGIGAADKSLQHPAALLDAAIMVQESGTGPASLELTFEAFAAAFSRSQSLLEIRG